MPPSEVWEARISGRDSVIFTPEVDEYIQISSVGLGTPVAVKGPKRPKRLPIWLSVNGNKFVIGTLSLTRTDPELVLKLKIAQQFKLSHKCKGLDVYIRGHSAKMAYEPKDEETPKKTPPEMYESDDEEIPQSEDEETPPEMYEPKDEETPKKTPPREETPPEMYESDDEEIPKSEDEETPPEMVRW